MNDDEVWKTYPGIEWLQGSLFGEIRTLDRYVICNDGRKRLIKGRVLKQQIQKDGYMGVGFGMGGKVVYLLVHRVIAACFLDNPDNLPEVNHKNNNPMDNSVSNLEWCTHEYNIEYREKYGTALNRPVIAINLVTLEASHFPSQREAARQLGAYQPNIKDVIKGRYKSHRGYYFTNADSNAIENVRAKFGDSVASKVEELLNKEE